MCQCKSDLITGQHGNSTAVGDDAAAIGNGGRQKGHIAAVGVDIAFIGNAAGTIASTATLGKAVVAVNKIFLIQVDAGSNQTAYIHLGTFTK